MMSIHSLKVLPLVAVFAGVLVLAACSSDDTARSAAPMEDTDADMNVQFGFSKSTRLCVINRSSNNIEVKFTKKDNTNGEGSLRSGSEACGSGTFSQGDDLTGTIYVPKWSRSYSFGAVNTTGGIPSAELQPDGCPQSRSVYFENASAVKTDDVLQFTTKRLRDTDFKEFTITVADESRPASTPRECW